MFAAIDAGCAAVRVNPGNIKAFDDKVGEIAKAAARRRASRSGSASTPGSLDKRLLAKYGKATPEALVESALWEASLFEEHGFRDFKISVKHNDPVVMVRAYELLAEACDYPLHLGVTEAGPAFQGTIKSSVAFGALLRKGIGDTIRVSLSAPPVEEVKVGLQILESLNLRQRRLEIVSCPSCGRAQVDVYTLADKVTAGLEGIEVPLRVAVMGCVVNGPGEAREADLGRRLRQRQGADLRPRRGHQDRARVADRRDADRGGAAHGRGDGRRGRALRRAHRLDQLSPCGTVSRGPGPGRVCIERSFDTDGGTHGHTRGRHPPGRETDRPVGHRRRTDDRSAEVLPATLAQEAGEDVPDDLTKAKASDMIDRLQADHRARRRLTGRRARPPAAPGALPSIGWARVRAG